MPCALWGPCGAQYALPAPVGWVLADLRASPWSSGQPGGGGEGGWRGGREGYLDAIVCDPPYGLRETTYRGADKVCSCNGHTHSLHCAGSGALPYVERLLWVYLLRLWAVRGGCTVR